MIHIETNHPVTNKAAEVWGKEGQLAILLEECGEVITAISRYNRGRTGHETIAEEMGDVIVCMMSAIPALGVEKEVKESIEYKIGRLKGILDGTIQRTDDNGDPSCGACEAVADSENSTGADSSGT